MSSNRIRILPEILSNKIAAGEVIERPSSVVKELLENAIDARSTQIVIEVEKGGRRLLRVSDNGSGMQRDDALLAIERYATSKIHSDQDLFAIRSLGFRGEALPSIASVSRFSLITRAEDMDTGTRIDIEGGKIRNVAETGAPPGTMVAVKQLFYNVPARRKFLKTVNTEMGHIADTVACIALGWPGIRFRLQHNGRMVKSWPAVSDPFDRVVDILGGDMRRSLHYLCYKDEHVAIKGWLLSPQMTRSTTRKIYIYVNGRFVRDPVMRHALCDGYRGRLMKGRFPVAVLFLEVPHDRLDVNVHPTKHEVRFADQNIVFEALKSAVIKTLEKSGARKWSDGSREAHRAAEAATPLPLPTVEKLAPRNDVSAKVLEGERDFRPASDSGRKKEHGLPLQPKKAVVQPEEMPKPSAGNDSLPVSCSTTNSGKTFSSSEPTVDRGMAEQARLWPQTFFADLHIIGQLHNTYILCGSDDGLILIDQHAAHERVLFEQLKAAYARSAGMAQKLLIPETVELGYEESDALEKLMPDLKAVGLEIEPFGGNTVVVKSVPVLLVDREIKPLIIEIAEKMVRTGVGDELDNVIEDCLTLMACHGALRAHQPLSDQQIGGLLNQLDACENPSHCPHGRPTWIQWRMTALEKAFGRTS